MSKPLHVEITSTSDRTAEVTPVILRDGSRKRLVFTPVLVNNGQNPAAAVRGELLYLSKNTADQWERDKPFDLRTLPAGESVRLELTTAELLQLHNCVGALYELMREDGFEYGTKRLLSVDAGTDLAEILDSISAIGQNKQVKRVLDWMSRQDCDQLADALQDAEPEIFS
ncbi:hypothetical protein [Amycolatopsis sp. H20-H5]|uniref:hypothetical protein n=1 Tax=Amycolatopsis sp. H20-H5 TaxID=3046309 RepID=UPI002DBCDD8D|nr:hypothetical protein [Amycolatopsis sp. H20-H5]MEC3977174.1 hypothetical protein [Amycolatopsis sp. H20-H5]